MATSQMLTPEAPAATETLHPGLAGIVLSRTRLSKVDGARGRLTLVGFPVETVAPQASFEEMVHLLWTGELPRQSELEELRSELTARRELPSATLELLRQAAARRVAPMDAVRMATASLELAEDSASQRFEAEALSVIARLPGIVAAYARLRRGEEPLPSVPDVRLAEDFLIRLTGEEPTPAAVRGLETYLATVSDHGANASTFTARVIVSTRSDLVSAVVGALGALKGPLHGGAPGPALDMVREIGEVGRAEAFLRAKLEAGERLMGFGHRVYKVRDPRAEVLAVAAERLYAESGDRSLYDLARGVETVALELLAEYKPGRRLDTNVEFYTALLLHGLGLESDLFTPVFAMGRAAGWIAHCREQTAEGKLIRPRLLYEGDEDRPFVELEER